MVDCQRQEIVFVSDLTFSFDFISHQIECGDVIVFLRVMYNLRL